MKNNIYFTVKVSSLNIGTHTFVLINLNWLFDLEIDKSYNIKMQLYTIMYCLLVLY